MKRKFYVLPKAWVNDSRRIYTELEKISLLQESKDLKIEKIKKPILITLETVNELINGITTNTFQVGDALLKENFGEALTKIDALLDSGEPALRILASLITQVRGWLWVSLLDQQGQKDVSVISKSAGIANPKRIYVIRKQIHNKSSNIFLDLLNRLLAVEIAIKKGTIPSNAFKDNFLTK